MKRRRGSQAVRASRGREGRRRARLRGGEPRQIIEQLCSRPLPQAIRTGTTALCTKPRDALEVEAVDAHSIAGVHAIGSRGETYTRRRVQRMRRHHEVIGRRDGGRPAT